MAAKKYRALVAVEWVDYEKPDKDGIPATVRYEAGDEFSAPPEHVNIAQLLKHRAVEEIRG